MAADKVTLDSYEEDLQRILAKERAKRMAYRAKMVLSWIGLLLILALLFSGFEINLGFTQINFIKLDPEFIKQYAPFIAKGALQTILISIASIAFAMILALSSALARLSKNAPAVALSTFYVSLIRGTPLYLQVIFFFLALPQMGIYFSGFWAGVIALSLNYGAYMSEIFRAGILSVSKGQHEAATKDSALVSVTGFVREILWRSQRVGRANFRNLEALLIAAFFYWMLTLVFTLIQTRIEARFEQGDGGVKALSH